MENKSILHPECQEFLDKKIAVLGLGYVGLPLAIEFGKIYNTIGFDINPRRVSELKNSVDKTCEINVSDFTSAKYLKFTDDPQDLVSADFIIIAVPTPVDENCVPDFSALISASSLVSRHMKKGAIIVYESTVFPGATEEICVPALETGSGMVWRKDFNVGYSPERVNPGDRERTLTKIVKVVSGDSDATLEVLGRLYQTVVKAGVYLARSIKVAEAAKVIENTQRDLNIALMNELSILFQRLNLDTEEVLKAAETKWNFMSFRPGLVGGHCIGVDPYYLTFKAQQVGYSPEVILAGRRINDNMAQYVADQLMQKFTDGMFGVRRPKICIMGLTFKENCSDIRNSKVIDLYQILLKYECEIFMHDPIASPEAVWNDYGIKMVSWSDIPSDLDAVIAAVPHLQYLQMNFELLTEKLKSSGIFMDLKSKFTSFDSTVGSFNIWRL